ncbi:unnamed protein product [Thlaspi arvense]|uniref:Uncharacterized protein n=1 Tax=Thlaspi arvense TaxID=13288 RepID=A0AAU9S548_THLAR|nr:unnamed protein product [Thlaspi arvense]
MSEIGKMYDVMLHEASLWHNEPPYRKRKLEVFVHSPPPEHSPPSPVDADHFSDEDDMDLVEKEKYQKQVQESCGFDVDFFNHTFTGIVPSGCTPYNTLFAKAGLHCYNIEKGKKLQLKSVVNVNAEIASMFNSYSTSEVIDPDDNSLHTFQTMVTDAVKEKNTSLILYTVICRIKPQVPGIGDASVDWDSDAVDEFYKTDLPDWPLNDGVDKLDLYEVKETELRDNEWLCLYAETALFTKWKSDLSAYMPFEMKKVMVQTKEDVESSMKLKSSNAIFFMSFKVRGGLDCRGIKKSMSDIGVRYDVMLDEARLWFDEPPRKLEDPVESLPSLVDADDLFDEDDMSFAEWEKYAKQVRDSCGFDVDMFFHTFGGIIPSGCGLEDTLFAKAGLHYYNTEKGKNLQFKRVVKVNAEIASMYNSYSTSEIMDPDDNSLHTFQTMVTETVKEKNARLILVTNICRIKPQVPGYGDATTIWDSDAVDEFYKTDLPDWPLNDGVDKLDLYEVKEPELHDNKWLCLYAETALFSEWQSDLSAYMPFEMKKVMVQTKENVESSMKLNSSNAIFYMTFKVRGGRGCRGIVRRTSDGRTRHMCLEARCWVDK